MFPGLSSPGRESLSYDGQTVRQILYVAPSVGCERQYSKILWTMYQSSTTEISVPYSGNILSCTVCMSV